MKIAATFNYGQVIQFTNRKGIRTLKQVGPKL